MTLLCWRLIAWWRRLRHREQYIFVGKGGHDDADGLGWERRKLTVAAAEQIARPGDVIVVGPMRRIEPYVVFGEEVER